MSTQTDRADFMICAGYKWLLGQFGDGDFFGLKASILRDGAAGEVLMDGIEGSHNLRR